MIKVGNKNLIILSTFLIAIMLCGAVSADTVNFSSDGKTLTIIPNLTQSTLKTSAITYADGIYGKGQYVKLKVSGIDNQGRNSYSSAVAFNNKLKSLNVQITKGLYYTKYSCQMGIKTAILKINGNTPNLTFSGSGTSDISIINGHQVLNNGLKNINYYRNGVLYAKVKVTSLFVYKSFNGDFLTVKQIDTATTAYVNGNTRKSIITTLYPRNSKGVLTGKKISGTSAGYVKINNKIVKYTGKIYVGTRYDPKDTLNEKYNTGSYKEIKTSSSPVLLKEIPLDT